MTQLLIGTLALSLGLNVYLLFRLKRTKRAKALSETSEFFRHLAMYRNGVLRVQVLDPSEVMVRSPTR